MSRETVSVRITFRPRIKQALFIVWNAIRRRQVQIEIAGMELTHRDDRSLTAVSG